MNKILEKRKINTYVNFPRRLYPVYNTIKKNINKDNAITIEFNSSNWNLASNALHFLDLLNFFNNRKKIYLDKSFLERKLIASKRKNFIEFKGKLIFKTKNNDSIILNDNDKLTNFDHILIEQNNFRLCNHYFY